MPEMIGLIITNFDASRTVLLKIAGYLTICVSANYLGGQLDKKIALKVKEKKG